jgi:hypothetical protein
LISQDIIYGHFIMGESCGSGDSGGSGVSGDSFNFSKWDPVQARPILKYLVRNATNICVNTSSVDVVR